MRKKTQQAIIAGIIGVVIITVVVVMMNSSPKGKIYTFEDGFHELQQIDERYSTSFHTEQLNKTMPAMEVIPAVLDDIKKFESTLDKKSNSIDVEALLLFSDIRKLMLTSEWYFQKAKEIGDDGLVNDAAGFTCREAPQIIDTSFYLNETFIYATRAQTEIDDLLYMYKYHPDVWRLVGINEDKTDFFWSDLKYIRHAILNNMESIDKYCKISGIKHQTSLTTLFNYTREEIPEEVFQRK